VPAFVDCSDRGASVVEYALVLSVLVAAALGVLPLLADAGAAAIDRQAACVATRPAPPECHNDPAGQFP
jgi:hypothetical protein